MATYNGTSGPDRYDGTPDADTISGLGGADTLAGSGGADEIRGGQGADFLHGYAADFPASDDGDPDRLYGGEGVDVLSLGLGDSGDGGAGNDTLSPVAAGSFSGGTGTDTLRVAGNLDITGSAIVGIERIEVGDGMLGARMTAAELGTFAVIGGIGGASALHIALSGGGSASLAFAPGVTRARIDGSAAGESLTLEAGSTVALSYEGGGAAGDVFAGAAADTLEGRGGADELHGGGGDDALHAYEADFPASDDGDPDRLYGEDGNDLLALGFGDRGEGGSGNDTLAALDAATLLGGAGGDIVIGSRGSDSLAGGAGGDTLSYERSTAAVVVSLAVAGAQATGGGGTDTLAAFENLRGGGAGDRLTGTSGANVIEGGAGDDTLSGGDGSDTASYAHATQGCAVDLALAGAQGTGGAGTDVLSGFENLLGGAGDDTLTGNAAANIVEGGGGNDLLSGAGGRDTASYAGAGAAVTVSLATFALQATSGAGSDVLLSFEDLRGSAFGDRLTAGLGGNLIEGLAGNDTLTGLDGVDTLSGGSGDDVYVVDGDDVVLEDSAGGLDRIETGTSRALSAETEDLALTGAAPLAGTGNASANRLSGNDGANLLAGLGGADTLMGGAATDTLAGGAGADRLTGDAGADTFDFDSVSESAPGAMDVILDFTGAGPIASDRIDVSGIDAGSAAGDQPFLLGTTLTLSNQGADTVLRGDINADGTFELAILIQDGGTPASAYTAADFVL